MPLFLSFLHAKMEADKPTVQTNILGYIIGGSIALIMFLIVLFVHLKNSKSPKPPLSSAK
jgi:hypothetical protein